MPTTLIYKLVGWTLLWASFGASCAFFGWRVPHDELVKFRAEVVQAGRTQADRATATDNLHQEEMKNAQKQLVEAVGGIDSYYKLHPVVRVRDVCASGSGMPQATSGAEGLDGATPSGYVSPYSPDEVEKVAARLNELQLLLVRDGVEIK